MDSGDHLTRVIGLHHIVIRAKSQGTDFVAAVADGGDHNHGNITAPAQGQQNIVPAHAG